MTGMAMRGVDVAAMEVDSGAGGGGDSDHEVAGGGGDFEGEFHDLVHGEDLDGSRANAEQAGERAGSEHDGESERDMLGVVGVVAGCCGVGSGQAEFCGEGIGFGCRGLLRSAAVGGVGGVEEDDSEDDGDGVIGESDGEPGSEESAERGGDFEKHSDADVGEALADVGDGGPGGGCDDGDERGSDCIAEVDFEEENECGHDDDAAAEAGERAEQAGEERGSEEQRSERRKVHALFLMELW